MFEAMFLILAMYLKITGSDILEWLQGSINFIHIMQGFIHEN